MVKQIKEMYNKLNVYIYIYIYIYIYDLQTKCAW